MIDQGGEASGIGVVASRHPVDLGGDRFAP
jgi:hypothetical protein